MAVECDTQEPLCLGSDLFPASHAETHETNTLDAPHDTCGHAEGRILLEVCISLQLSVFFVDNGRQTESRGQNIQF